MPVQEFSNQKDYTAHAIQFITDVCAKIEGTICIALSGGNTPKLLYDALANSPIPFERIEFFQVDERAVPADHTDSNANMIYQTLISKIKPKAFHTFNTELPIPEALQNYAQALPPAFHLTLLGIGPDGHTASLFPNSPVLTTQEKTAHTQTENFPVKDRLTLTFGPILQSQNLLVLIKNKPKILRELQHPTKTPEEFPALKLLEHKNLTVFSLN